MLIILSALALFTPVFSAYVIGVVMMIVMIFGMQNNLTNNIPNNISADVRRGGLNITNDDLTRYRNFVDEQTRRSCLLWLLLVTSASIAALMTAKANHGDLVRSIGHLGVKYVLLWFVLTRFWRRIAGKAEILKLFALTYAAAAFVHFLYAVYQRHSGADWVHGFSAVLPQGRFAYGVYRISGFMGHPLTMGYCQSIAAVCCFGFLRVTGNRSEKFAWILATSCASMVVALSGSRGPQIAMTAGIMASLPMSFWRQNIKKILLCGIIVLFSGYYAGFFLRFLEIFQRGSGGDMRTVHWTVFWRIFTDYPIFGLGPAAPREVISSYYKALGASDNIRLAHNTWLQFAAEFGLVGLAGAMYWCHGWWVFGRKLGHLADLGRGLFVVIIVGSLTQNNLQDSQFLYAITMWSILIALREVSFHDISSRNANNEDLNA
jgi:hypothetical protein